MGNGRILIDTNVFIGLEDGKAVPPEFADLLALCQKHNVSVFIHEAAIRDVRRDKDRVRQGVSLSKLRKFRQLKGQKGATLEALELLFGRSLRPNDEVDLALLHSLHTNAIDFLVTQDQGIHTRARRAAVPLDKRVLNVADAILWLKASFEPKEVRLPLIEEVIAHEIPLSDPIFDSLRDGYPTFDAWWNEKCVPAHRECWVATIDSQLAGLVVREEETHQEANTTNPGEKILKVCTFKVKPEFRGEKLGEQFLKQIIWYAQRNSYDLVYLTTFPEQAVLIRVISYFGFQQTQQLQNGELVFEKPIRREALRPRPNEDIFETIRTNYPRFTTDFGVKSFCVPIQGDYHNILFPELAERFQGDLFTNAGVSVSDGRPRLPGNTIRKVYICRAKTAQLTPGSVLLFYRSKSPGFRWSQYVTTVGIVEAVSEASTIGELIKATGKRSVYSQSQLKEMIEAKSTPVRVIDFLLIGHLEKPMPLDALLQAGTFVGHPPQSICELPDARLKPIRARFDFGFAL